MTQITFIENNGKETTVEAEDGLSIMVAAQDNNIEGIKAICNGCCSCGTCHITLSQSDYDSASTKYSGEQQVLDKMRNTEPLSRLSCQVIVTSELSGAKIKVK